MNIERLKILRDDVARRETYADRPAVFSMNKWFESTGDDCGTAGCLAGFALMRINDAMPDAYSSWARFSGFSNENLPAVFQAACWYLEIDITSPTKLALAEHIFTPDFILLDHVPFGDVLHLEIADFMDTPGGSEFIRQCAIKMLDRLIETGECDWREVYERFPQWKGEAAAAAVFEGALP